MGEVIHMPTPSVPADMKCTSCGGPIGVGEPVCLYEGTDGKYLMVHRFKSTCEAHQN